GVELRAAASPGPRPNTLGDRPDTRPQGRTRDEAAPRGSLAPPPPAAGTGRRPPAHRGRAGIRVAYTLSLWEHHPVRVRGASPRAATPPFPGPPRRPSCAPFRGARFRCEKGGHGRRGDRDGAADRRRLPAGPKARQGRVRRGLPR